MRYLFLTISFVLIFICVSVSAYAETFNTYCQSNYEDDWHDENEGAPRLCTAFTEEMEGYGHTLHYLAEEIESENFYPENDNDPIKGIEGSNTAFMATHGVPGKLAAFEKDVYISGNEMELGNGSISILAIFSCNTMILTSDHAWMQQGDNDPKWEDHKDDPDFNHSSMYELWGNTMSGGIKVILGSASLFSGKSDEEPANVVKFVRALNNKESISKAWLKNIQRNSPNQRPRALFSGQSTDDCLDRLYNMTLSNMDSFPRLRGDEIETLCWITKESDSSEDFSIDAEDINIQ